MTSAIVVGSGIAGLVTALRAADAGIQVTLITKRELADANTTEAQGGIAAVTFADDSTDMHRDDTFTASAGTADLPAVTALVSGGARAIDDLVRWGVPFDRDASGAYIKGLEAAHSYPRVLHAGGDATGRGIQDALIAQVRTRNITVRTHSFLEDIILHDGRAAGISVRDARGLDNIYADAVVLATGGAGQLYSHTTNPVIATGDGIAAALRVGARTTDLEFVQFHPTVLAVGEAFLISEAVRGEGAILLDDAGRRFCFDAHPAGELAPRDIVARAIASKMAQQDGRPVRLDATAMGRRFLHERFPTITAAIDDRGLDWSTEPVPVTPAAHYLMGGVDTDLSGRTSIPALFAVGEVARTGVHGANRLASNSLLEGAVFAARAADALRDVYATPWRTPWRTPSKKLRSTSRGEARGAAAVRSTTTVHAKSFTRARLQNLMWMHAGLERSEQGLAHAAEVLAAWSRQVTVPGATNRTARELISVHEDRNLIDVATAVVAAARVRTTSIGAHFRIDERGFALDPSPSTSFVDVRDHVLEHDHDHAQNRETASC